MQRAICNHIEHFPLNLEKLEKLYIMDWKKLPKNKIGSGKTAIYRVVNSELFIPDPDQAMKFRIRILPMLLKQITPCNQL